MKDQIDNLVRSILHDLVQPEPTYPELAAFYVSIGADGPARAATKRGILGSYGDDMNLSSDVRQYVQQQLDALPVF